jgi:hypothetical protein
VRSETRIRLLEILRDAEPRYQGNAMESLQSELLSGSPPSLVAGTFRRLRRIDGFDLDRAEIASLDDLCRRGQPYFVMRGLAAAWAEVRDLSSSAHAMAVRVPAAEFERRVNAALDLDSQVTFRIRKGQVGGRARQLPPVSADGLAILNLAADVQLMTGKPISGRILHGPRVPDVLQGRLDHILSELVPTRLFREPDALEEIYTLTLEGMLASQLSARVKALLESTLKLVAERFGQEQEFPHYTWAELQTVGKLGTEDFHLADEVLRASGLSAGGGGSPAAPEYRWVPPKDIVAGIYKDPSLDAFLGLRELTQVVRYFRSREPAEESERPLSTSGPRRGSPPLRAATRTPNRASMLHRENDEEPPTRVQLFISHSAKDAAFVEPLIVLLRSALTLPATDVRCTSVDGYRLPAGADTNAQLRREVQESAVLLGVISSESISSLYVVFELGARWGTGKTFIPLLAPGSASSLLGGPLAGINALRLDNEAQVHQLLHDVGRHLRRRRNLSTIVRQRWFEFSEPPRRSTTSAVVG